MKKLLIPAAFTVAVAGLSSAAHAIPQVTTLQSHSVSSSVLSGSTILYFDGFNVALGTLEGVDLNYTLNATLNNTAAVVATIDVPSPGDQSVGSPTPLSATATTTITTGTGLVLINLSSTLTTPGFVGTVTTGPLNTVGTASDTGVTGGQSFTTPPTSAFWLDGVYEGGTNAVGVTVSESGTATGSVTANVLEGDNGTYSVTVTLQYRYDDGTVATPEPATIGLLGVGMAGMGLLRRRRQASR